MIGRTPITTARLLLGLAIFLVELAIARVLARRVNDWREEFHDARLWHSLMTDDWPFWEPYRGGH